MSRNRAKYAGDSRTTLWRRKLEEDCDSTCQCEFHMAADEHFVCNCEFHQAAQGQHEQVCTCEFHRLSDREHLTTSPSCSSLESNRDLSDDIHESLENAGGVILELSPPHLVDSHVLPLYLPTASSHDSEGEDLTPYSAVGSSRSNAGEIHTAMAVSSPEFQDNVSGEVISTCAVSSSQSFEIDFDPNNQNVDEMDAEFNAGGCSDPLNSHDSYTSMNSSRSSQHQGNPDDDNHDYSSSGEFEYSHSLCNEDLGQPGGPENPDEDPDEPDWTASDDDSSGSSDEDDSDNFTLNDASLNGLLEMVEQCSKREALALILAIAVRHVQTYEEVIHTCIAFNTVLGRNFLPTSKKGLWRILRRKSSGITKRAYCNKCTSYLGRLNALPDPVVCLCGYQIGHAKVKYFVTLSLGKQLLRYLHTPGTWDLLQYRRARQEKFPGATEDLLDGQAYEDLKRDGNVLSSPMNFSYILNTDGFQVTETGRTVAWPLFIRLNEVPPQTRQRNVFLVALWIDRKEPPHNMFLRAFVKEANKLSTTGLAWKPDGVNEIVSKFVPTVFCVDAKARSAILNLKQCTGYYGCTFCDERGLRLGGCAKFPVPGSEVLTRVRNLDDGYDEVPVIVPPGEIRTDHSIKTSMIAAYEDGREVRGVMGPSELMNLHHFDLGIGFSTDDLHPLFRGVTAFHTDLLMKASGILQVVAVINSRLASIKTPTNISRKPRGIEEREKWTATEWRNWLLYYSSPCLLNQVEPAQLHHLQLLANAVFIVSRDVVTEEGLLEAELCFTRYIRLFQQHFGPENMRFNIHVLKHVVSCVRNWGPIWSHSTFGFESWNHTLMKTAKSPKCAIDQVVSRYLMTFLVSTLSHNNEISDRVKSKVEYILKGAKLHDTTAKVGDAYLLGRGERRAPSLDERNLLAAGGYASDEPNLQVKKAGMECRSGRYTANLRSDNSIVYTYDDMFCEILSIITFQDGQNNVIGMIVKVLIVDHSMPRVPYIARVRGDDQRAFIPLSSVRNLVIKIHVAGQTYVMPLTNHLEID